MLPKLFAQIDSQCKVKLNKYTSTEDISSLGAVECGERIRFKLSVPRRLGASGGVLRIARDGKRDKDIPLTREKSDAEADIYAVELDTEELCEGDGCGLFYYEFLFLRKENTLFTGTYNNKDFTLETRSTRRFRLLVYRRGFETPAAFGRGVMYQVFTDRFCRGESDEAKSIAPRPDAVMIEDWDNGVPEYAPYPGAPMKNNTFFGGNLWGVAEKLDYLKSLGVTYIYLCPIFRAYSNHKYDTADYEKIDEMFGGEKAFDNLVKKAREKGIGIILDGVFNHTGDNSKYFNKYRKFGKGGAYNDPKSPYVDWYKFLLYPDEYESWWGIRIMPKLDQHNENCRKYFTSKGGIIEKYIKKGIAGWRLDVADELCDEFLDELRATAKDASGGEAVIIGEVWENASDKVAYGQRRRYFLGDQLDSVMNYPLKNAIVSFCLYGDGDMLYNTLTEIYASYPKAVSNKLMNLLGTHDTERIFTVLGKDRGDENEPNGILAKKRLDREQRERALVLLKIAAALQFTAYGIPSIFYGDEVGLEGYGDPFCRMPFPWNDIDTQYRSELLSYYRKLGNIRAENKAFDGGDFNVLSHTKHAIAYTREKNDSKILVIANRGGAFTLELPCGDRYLDLVEQTTYEKKITVPANSALILKQMADTE